MASSSSSDQKASDLERPHQSAMAPVILTREDEEGLHALEEKIGQENGIRNTTINNAGGGQTVCSVPGAYACASTPSTSASDVEIGEMTRHLGSRSHGTADHEGLVEAVPVEQIDETTLPRAEWDGGHLNGRSKGSTESKQRLLMGGILCLLLVAVTVAVVLSKGVTHTKAALEGEWEEGSIFLEDDLPTYTLEAILADDTSPQAWAHRWLMADPQLANYTSRAQLIQRFALATFFFATSGNHIITELESDLDNSNSNVTESGDTWKAPMHYLSYDMHECDWYLAGESYSTLAGGVVTTGYPCTEQPMSLWEYIPYTKLWVAGNTLVGTLPEELFLLTSLESIDLSLQHSPWTLQESWSLSYTHDLAVQIFGGPSSTDLAPFENCLGGTLSSHIGQLTNLQELKLGGNCFQGTLPTEIGLLHKSMKQEFRILGNYFSGTIPIELFALSSLRFLALSLNDFTGTIPPDIGRATSLTFFGASGNSQLRGTLPSELGILKSLYYLAISDNRHTGTIPTELGQIEFLHGLTIENNQITGQIPSELGNLKILGVLNLSGNQISGSLPSELAGMSNGLYSLHLQNNLLSSSIPSEYGALTGLHELFLEDNGLQFQLPTEIGHLSRLHHLTLQNNRLSGSIPTEIGLWGANTTVMEYDVLIDLVFEINLSGNLLKGSIPSELAMLTLWQDLNLVNNNLSGVVPKLLCRPIHNDESIATLAKASSVVQFDCHPERLCGCDCTCADEDLP